MNRRPAHYELMTLFTPRSIKETPRDDWYPPLESNIQVAAQTLGSAMTGGPVLIAEGAFASNHVGDDFLNRGF